MIVKEIRVGDSIVRIHDDYLEDSPQVMLDRVAQITSDSYKRRVMEHQGKAKKPSGTESA